MTLRSWDIFCAVVDNYGDIGVCWRLARQLAAEHGLKVRLWVDDLGSLQRLCPEAVPVLDAQVLHGVEVRHWPRSFSDAQPIEQRTLNPFAPVAPAEVVIEAFACELPENYVAAMAEMPVKPVWINLEYLSAENWVPGFHGGASRHPSLPLIKYFYFPGFTPKTGGLLREKNLGQGFDATGFWKRHGIPQRQPDEVRISLFGYENHAVPSLLQAWAEGAQPVICLLPEGRIAADVYAWFGQEASVMQRGNLTVQVMPFMAQDEYDQLLWACDFNFVRGEDSFVRAQWAGKPFVWHIYPQQDDAHWPKLNAFLDLYCQGLPSDAAAVLRAFWHGWNRGTEVSLGWSECWSRRAVFEQHACDWRDALKAQGDLAEKLVFFCKNKV
jgi:uncharacterized repeat protein (TIGR03837 family)